MRYVSRHQSRLCWLLLQRRALQKRVWSYAWDVMDDLSSVPREYSMQASSSSLIRLLPKLLVPSHKPNGLLISYRLSPGTFATWSDLHVGRYRAVGDQSQWREHLHRGYLQCVTGWQLPRHVLYESQGDSTAYICRGGDGTLQTAPRSRKTDPGITVYVCCILFYGKLILVQVFSLIEELSTVSSIITSLIVKLFFCIPYEGDCPERWNRYWKDLQRVEGVGVPGRYCHQEYVRWCSGGRHILRYRAENQERLPLDIGFHDGAHRQEFSEFKTRAGRVAWI